LGLNISSTRIFVGCFKPRASWVKKVRSARALKIFNDGDYGYLLSNLQFFPKILLR